VKLFAASVVSPVDVILIADTLSVDVLPNKSSTVIFLDIGEPAGSSMIKSKSVFAGAVNAVNCVTFLSAISIP
jgi:hypothetical protein